MLQILTTLGTRGWGVLSVYPPALESRPHIPPRMGVRAEVQSPTRTEILGLAREPDSPPQAGSGGPAHGLSQSIRERHSSKPRLIASTPPLMSDSDAPPVA